MKRAVIALAALALTAAKAPEPFRIGVIGDAPGPCAQPGPTAPAGEKAYFDLLAKRLGRKVLACPVASAADGAAGLAAGKLDMAALDAAAWPAARSSARATLTVRANGGLTRVPVVLAVRGDEATGAEALKGRTLALGGASPVAQALPQAVLAEQGFGVFGRELVAADEAAALAALRARKADAVALEAAAWQRQCRGNSPSDKPCGDLKVVWRARPQAARAFAVRRELPERERFRLIGVHVAMHLEDKAAFAWAASQLAPDAADFEAAEADALAVSRLQ
jgi:ABC-type phosphate/phosphonate transport system substrate-binding protein